jgi:5-methylcytosine-specific restriction endonuclease McrA
MPTVPTATKCSTLGCKNTKAKFSSLCTEHGGRDTFNHQRYNQTEKRKDASDRYNTKQWRTLRQIQLSQYPICAGCKAEGIIRSAEHVDHIFPWQQIGEHAFVFNLFQSLCPSCHSSKTQLEQQGIFRAYGDRDYTTQDYRIAVANPK